MNASNIDVDSEVEDQGINTHTKDKVPIGTIVCPMANVRGSRSEVVMKALGGGNRYTNDTISST